jgi:hypothetical protein
MRYLCLLLLLTSMVSYAGSPLEVPINAYTPGVANDGLTRAEICDNPNAEEKFTPSEVSATLVTYAVTPTANSQWITHITPAYAVKMAIPALLGGKNVATNRWPQSTSATYYNDKRRDALVRELWQLVCNNKSWVTPLPLATAQTYAKGDWRPHYRTYVNTQFPTPIATATPTPTATNTPTPTATNTPTPTATNTPTPTATDTPTPTPTPTP